MKIFHTTILPEDVLLEPDGDDSATDFLPDHELLAEHRQHQVLPAPGTQTWQECLLPITDSTNNFLLRVQNLKLYLSSTGQSTCPQIC